MENASTVRLQNMSNVPINDHANLKYCLRHVVSWNGHLRYVELMNHIHEIPISLRRVRQR